VLEGIQLFRSWDEHEVSRGIGSRSRDASGKKVHESRRMRHQAQVEVFLFAAGFIREDAKCRDARPTKKSCPAKKKDY